MTQNNSPTIRNLYPRDDLGSFSRRQGSDHVYQTVKINEVENLEQKGWEIQRLNKASARMFRKKAKSELLKSRVWRVMFKMEFTHLSGERGANVLLNGSDPESPTNQIDVVAIDDEVAIAVDCKSYQSVGKDLGFAEKLAKHARMRKPFANAVHFEYSHRRRAAMVMVVWDLDIRDTDRKRAEQDNILLLDEEDLEYYETLVNHLGPAAKYQLLSEAFRGKTIRDLKIRVPALEAKMGSRRCYTFSVRPEYLLKIAYVAHRAKGKKNQLNAYQRMISKRRLKAIGEFINENGIFPTNIVVNLENTRALRFERGRQEDAGEEVGGKFGWLTLSPGYGSAWIIDGQHRLFAYSGHPRASTSFLNVLAFAGLSPAEQTTFFVDINSEQRKVSRSLLWELDALLKWNAPEEDKRVHAVISQAVMMLDRENDSPLYGRILLADAKKTKTRCVSLTAVATALNKPGFFVVKRLKGSTTYGPLWRNDTTDALHRTVRVVKAWLGEIAKEAKEWWELGASEGGGLAMNDGVTVCINMLRSVLEHVDESGEPGTLSDEDIVQKIKPYAIAVGGYFARMTPEEQRWFRQLRGGQGHDTGTRDCQEALQAEFPDYEPDGLAEWSARRQKNTNDEARRIIIELEKVMQARIIEMLKDEFGLDDQLWWYEGVPENVRMKVRERVEKAGGGREEEYFDLLHYEAIIKSNWGLFKDTFAYGEKRNVGKDKGTAWIRELGKWRNVVMHPSRRSYLGVEELSTLQTYQAWLMEQLGRAP